jgi:hypothetical protein
VAENADPEKVKSESLVHLIALNKLLHECISRKDPNTKDIVIKIWDTCKGSILNLCSEIQESGLFKSVLSFLSGGIGNDFELVSACFGILDSFEIDRDSNEAYLAEENMAIFAKMASYMDQPWYDNYISLISNISGSTPKARDQIAKSEIAETILGYLEDDKIDIVPQNSKPFLYIASFLCSMIDPVCKKHVTLGLAKKYFRLGIKMVSRNMANEETLQKILWLFRYGLTYSTVRNNLIHSVISTDAQR